jgi:hypothetical protein
MTIASAYDVFANVYVNPNRKAGCRYVYTYTPSYSPEKKRTLKKNIKCIGKIMAEDGLGEVLFNRNFLTEHPEFMHLKAVRTGKKEFRIEERNDAFSAAAASSSSSKPHAMRMKIGATRFICESFRRSFSGKTLMALEEDGEISPTLRRRIETLVAYTVLNGVGRLADIEFFARTRVVPCGRNFDHDAVLRTLSALTGKFATGFYWKKQELMNSILAKAGSSLRERKCLAFDGYSIDPALLAHGGCLDADLDPCFFLLTDEETGTLLERCGRLGCAAESFEEALRRTIPSDRGNCTIAMDMTQRPVSIAGTMLSKGLGFICRVPLSHGVIRKFLGWIIEDLSRGNGCDIIRRGGEVFYARQFNYAWNSRDENGKRSKRHQIWLSAFYSPMLAARAGVELAKEAALLNKKHGEYEQELQKTIEQHKKKPEKPDLTAWQKILLEQGVIRFNNDQNRYEVAGGKAAGFFVMTQGVRLVASSREMTSEELLDVFCQRDEIEKLHISLREKAKAAGGKIPADNLFEAWLFLGLLAFEFKNAVRMRAKKWNAKAPRSGRVEFKDNSIDQTLCDLDAIECTLEGDKIIPAASIEKQHQNLFEMMGIEPLANHGSKRRKASAEDGL